MRPFLSWMAEDKKGDWTGKPAHTKRELRELVSSVRDGTFHYYYYDEGRPPPKRSLDWSSYDEAQSREVSDMLALIKRFVELATGRVPPEEYERSRRRSGRPITIPPSDVAKALLLQSYFGVSNRVAADLVDLFKEKLGISRAFSYKTIERGYDPSLVTRVLQEVFRLTNEYGNAKEDTFSFDGTGDITSSKANYESARSEQRKKDEVDDKGSWPSSSSSSSRTMRSFQFAESSVGVTPRSSQASGRRPTILLASF
jgi:hypothetical protein